MIGLALAALWFTLSGRTEYLLLVLGAASIVVVVVLLGQMAIIDSETAGVRRILPLAFYWMWLGGEIFKANIAVARAILKIDLDLTPRMTRVRFDQKTDFGKTIFANSITLTPGTVTVAVEEGEFVVHALLEAMTDPAGFEAMNRRVAQSAEGGGP
jgi:multicomponent Na+:H+ antiporter subunit E